MPHFPYLSGLAICKDFGEKKVGMENLLLILLFFFFLNTKAEFYNQVLTSDLFIEKSWYGLVLGKYFKVLMAFNFKVTDHFTKFGEKSGATNGYYRYCLFPCSFALLCILFCFF